MDQCKCTELTEERIIQNLKDAGCDDAAIEAFLNALRRCGASCAAKMLECHRRELLEALHAEQRRIDCLDYLLFMLKKQGGIS